MGITESFVGLLSRITPDSLPAEAIDAARRLILDGMAVVAARAVLRRLRKSSPRIWVSWAERRKRRPSISRLQDLDGISHLYQRRGDDTCWTTSRCGCRQIMRFRPRCLR